MRKFFYASVILLLFAIAIAVTEISCQKTIAQSNNNENASGIMLISKAEPQINVSYTINTDSSVETHTNTYAPTDYFIANIDGSDIKQIPINLPGNIYVASVGSGAKLSDDGKTLVFYAADIPNYQLTNAPYYPVYVYSCSVDGSNLKKLFDSYRVDDVH